MEENLLSLPSDSKVYKDRAVYVGTFLGGPLIAGYLSQKILGTSDNQTK